MKSASSKIKTLFRRNKRGPSVSSTDMTIPEGGMKPSESHDTITSIEDTTGYESEDSADNYDEVRVV